MLAGCAQIEDDLGNCPVGEAAESPYPVSYISLRITSATDSSAGTRATPTGGENGDGRENGLTASDDEVDITSVIAFFYKNEDVDASNGNAALGINGNTNNPGLEVTPVYFTDMQSTTSGSDPVDKVVTTEQQSLSLATDTYRVLAVANPSDDLLKFAMDGDTPKTGITLGELRDFIDLTSDGKAWKETASGTSTNYTNFVMSSEFESEVDLSQTDNGGATAEVTVERVAARVDYYGKSSTFTIGAVTTGVIYDEEYKDATVTIQGAALINVLNSGSYLFKRVTANTYSKTDEPTINSSSDVNYLGKETPTEGGVATNYVLDPWTTGKTTTGTIGSSGNIVDADGNHLTYDETNYSYYSGEASQAQQDPSYWATLITKGEKNQILLSDNFTRLGYALENTTFAPYTSKQYSTGVVFKALFDPSSITATNTFINSCYSSYEYKSGNTFFKYNDVLYATLEDLMCAALGDTFAKEFMTSTTVASTLTTNSIESWSDLGTYIKNMSVDPLGYKDYLTGLCADESGDVGTNADITYYLKSTFGYSYDSTNGVQLDQNSKTTYTALLAKNVTTYKDGICYYVWWIRHSNDGTDLENGIMEYSIVRNNVYKLTVSSVSTLGGAIPTEGLLMNVSVKPWRFLEQEQMDM